MTKQDIIEYVMNTPHNTNKAVLSSMLSQIENDSSNSIVVKTIHSTIANPFLDGFETIDVQNIYNQLMFNQVTLILVIDGEILGVGPIVVYMNSDFDSFYCSQAVISENEVSAFEGVFTSQGNLQYFKYAMGETIVDGLSYADLISSTLTIIYHPYTQTYVDITYIIGQATKCFEGVPLDTVVDTRKPQYFPNEYMNWIIDKTEGDIIQKDEYMFKIKGYCTIYLKQSENVSA